MLLCKWITYDFYSHSNYSCMTLFPPIFPILKVRGAYYTQKLDISFLSGYVQHYIHDGMTEFKLYLSSKLTNV